MPRDSSRGSRLERPPSSSADLPRKEDGSIDFSRMTERQQMAFLMSGGDVDERASKTPEPPPRRGGRTRRSAGSGLSSSTTDTGASTSVTGAIRLELDMSQGNAYTAADRNSSPAGLTNFPVPGEITPQGRLRMLSNTGMPKLITSYIAPFTSSNDAYIQVGFDANQGGLFSGSLRRLTIFRYGAD